MDSLTNALMSSAEWVLQLLPHSPFQFLSSMANMEFYQYIKWLNWFIPVDVFLVILADWCGCILVWYLYQVALRWVKVIE